MKPVFRTEAFIVPISNKSAESASNVIDDVKMYKIQQLNPEKISTDSNIEERHKEDVKIENNLEKIHSSCNLNSHICLPAIRIDDVESVNREDEGSKERENNINDNNSEKNINENDKQNNINDDYFHDIREHIYDMPFSHIKNTRLSLQNHHDDRKDENKKDELYEPIYDVPYSGNKKPEPEKLRERFETGEYVSLQMISRQKFKKNNKYFPKPPLRTSSLMSIDERGETPDHCNDDFCCHGYKNGCTAATKRPEEVTEGIFEVNWMKRLEQLRAKEQIIKDKEALLFDREKLLFKKEKELRILERLLKDKLKHADLYLRRFKSCSSEFTDFEMENKCFDKPKEYPSSKYELSENFKPHETVKASEKRSTEDITRELVTQEILRSCGSLDSGMSLTNENVMKNPPNSCSSLITTASSAEHHTQVLAKSESGSNPLMSKHFVPGCSAYSSTRVKRRPKINYDDLDSTLSADVGDSSFVITSKKFDPGVFKKPQAFTRTMSERRPRPVSERLPDCQYEDEKLLKRLSHNIVGSHRAKFQNYGLIDANKIRNDESTDVTSDKRCSYLSLDEVKQNKTGSLRSRNKEKKSSKDVRPFSWNEDTNEWLQKKRQAYNDMQTAKRLLMDNFENKENHGSYSKAQKKLSKEKKFHIFR